jgi:hypothetical protein
VVTSLPLLARLALIPLDPIPKPMLTDEFSHLLVADTFASGRIVNPTHPFWEHFDTIYEFQQPVYASIYFPGHGLVMAIGQAVGGHPWWGVWASTGLMCGAICWMLSGWVEPPWALVGGLICVFRFGLVSYWMDSYMGGSVPALGGALALGALPRLIKTSRATMAIVLALGFVITLSVRPYEGLLLGCATGLSLLVWLVRSGQPFRHKLLSIVLPISSVLLLAVSAGGYYNFRVTGSALRTPYELSQRLYGVPRGLFGKTPTPATGFRYTDQRDVHEWQNGFRTPFRSRLKEFWRFYLGSPFTIVLFLLPLARGSRVWYLAVICGFVGMGQWLYWYFLPHYFAPVTAALVGLVVFSLRELWNWRLLKPVVRRAAVIAILLADAVISATHQGMPFLNDGFREYRKDRTRIEKQLNAMGGRHLVFVQYSDHHPFFLEWIYNPADIDQATIVWARLVDPSSDARLVEYLGGRSAWVADVDAKPVRLSQWRPSSPDLGVGK